MPSDTAHYHRAVLTTNGSRARTLQDVPSEFAEEIEQKQWHHELRTKASAAAATALAEAETEGTEASEASAEAAVEVRFELLRQPHSAPLWPSLTPLTLLTSQAVAAASVDAPPALPLGQIPAVAAAATERKKSATRRPKGNDLVGMDRFRAPGGPKIDPTVVFDRFLIAECGILEL
eukprot:SAG11_NODE_3225_length_2599_cov_17.320400_2_plen_177_part_00